MAYLIGYSALPVIIAVLLTNLPIAKSYREKHGREMGVGRKVLYIVGIAVGILFLLFLGKIA